MLFMVLVLQPNTIKHDLFAAYKQIYKMSQAKKKQLINQALAKQNKSSDINTDKKPSSKWNSLIQGIVRPPRTSYPLGSLGPQMFMMNDRIFEREDHLVEHPNSKKIHLSIFKQQNKQQYVILYLHGNTSNRLQCFHILRYTPAQFAVASFDFLGCGNNEDQSTISLGFREAEQAKTVIEMLKKLSYKVLLWGKSMGASTAILAGSAEIIVADSAFVSFRSLCKEVTKQYSPQRVPNCLIECLFPCVFMKLSRDIKKNAHYDVNSLNILRAVKNLPDNTFLVLLSGDQDELINQGNSEKLYREFKGPKKHLQIFEGTHNSKRPEHVIRKIMDMLLHYTINDKEKCTATKQTSSESSRPFHPFGISKKQFVGQLA